MTISTEKVIAQTKCWIHSVIVAFNFCPFAKRELERDRVYYKVVKDTTTAAALESFITECFRLDSKPEIETSFLIFANNFLDFKSFIELVDLANELLITQNYEGIYQIASFHPGYCFAETSEDDTSNYTNRSPFPMLHLLRESSLTQALQNYPDPEFIPVRNIEKATELGNTVFQRILDNCKK